MQLNYIVDFWGQYPPRDRSRARQLLATNYGQDVVQISLISLVARITSCCASTIAARCTRKKRSKPTSEILQLNTIKFKGGDAAITDVYQAQVLVQQAEAEVISLQQVIAQTENNISILLGKNPQDIPRGLTLVDQAHLPDVPAGLPSALLQRRPDVRRDEENLVAANANVGVAKAAFFPQISLTGQFGAQSTCNYQLPRWPRDLLVGRRSARPAHLSGRPHPQRTIVWPGRSATKPN